MQAKRTKAAPPIQSKPQPTLLQLVARPYDALGEALYRLDCYEGVKHDALIERLSKVSDTLEAIHEDLAFMFFGESDRPDLGDSDYDYGPGWGA